MTYDDRESDRGTSMDMQFGNRNEGVHPRYDGQQGDGAIRPHPGISVSENRQGTSSADVRPQTTAQPQPQQQKTNPVTKRNRGRGGRSHSGTARAVSPDTIESILDAADRVRGLHGTDALLLRGFLGVPANTGDAKLISTFISKDGRSQALKKIDSEMSIIDSINPDEPMDMNAAFAIVGLGHDGRLEHWTMLSTFDSEAAKAVAGTDDGKWPRAWNRSDMDESKGLFSLYLKVRGPYKAKLEELRGLLS